MATTPNTTTNTNTITTNTIPIIAIPIATTATSRPVECPAVVHHRRAEGQGGADSTAAQGGHGQQVGGGEQVGWAIIQGHLHVWVQVQVQVQMQVLLQV